MMYSQYGPLSTAVYDFTKPVGVSLNGDIDYYYERLADCSGLILEAGVGTGRMLIPLLEKGLTIHGIDQSSDMLAQCQKNCATRHLSPSLFTGSLETMALADTYAAIIMPTATFCMLESERAALQTLRNLYQHLTPGGRLIIELDLPFYPEVGEVTTTSYQLTPSSGITLESKIIAIDWLTQQITSHLTYQKWQAGTLIASELQCLKLRWYGLTEFSLLLEKTGFRNIVISADYAYGHEPTDSNQTITFEAFK